MTNNEREEYRLAALAAGIDIMLHDRGFRNITGSNPMTNIYSLPMWRPKTDKKNQLPTWQAFELAISGIDPDDVPARQIELFDNEEDDDYGYAQQKNFD